MEAKNTHDILFFSQLGGMSLDCKFSFSFIAFFKKAMHSSSYFNIWT